ncbi:MAG: xanthine dehydrogenase family protein molybdopterin-binding subunit, partial [Planctomycetota bacterium]
MADYKLIGRSPTKVDGLAKCTGATKYADDLVLPRMLFCKLHRADVAHARIKSVDTSAAEEMPGVMAVLTGAELPTPFGILPVSQDEHALCPDRVRFVGDPVAAVAAIDEDTAFLASQAIRVEYEPLAAVYDPAEALRNDVPALHEYGDDGNVHKRVSMQFGDVPRALEEADEVLTDVFFF